MEEIWPLRVPRLLRRRKKASLIHPSETKVQPEKPTPEKPIMSEHPPNNPEKPETYPLPSRRDVNVKTSDDLVAYEELKEKYGERMKEIPMGAVGIYTHAQKFRTGLQQIMAGSRNFRLSTMSRDDLMSLTEEASKVSKIPYVMEARYNEAMGALLD